MCEIAKIDQALLSFALDYDKKTVVKDQKKLDSQVVAQNLKRGNTLRNLQCLVMVKVLWPG